MEDPINLKADLLVKKIKHFLITQMGKVESEATIEEFYQAFCFALREEIMINWTASLKTYETLQEKIIYYLSMEYMPGKFLGNNITNIGLQDLVNAVVKKTNKSLSEIEACESDPGLGNGGLGRLASCFLDSLATMQYPAMGYGLRYQYGIFEQELWKGEQIERPDCWLLNYNPWEIRKDLHSVSVRFKGKPKPATNIHGNEVFSLDDYEEVRAIPYDMPIVGYGHDSNFSVVTMRLWTTKESPKNFELQRYNSGELGQAGENTSLTDVLYPNDNHETGKRIRLKQEFLLVSSSLQDMLRYHLSVYGDLSNFKDKVQIQINDTHPALIIAELTRRLNKNYDFSWQQAWETVQCCCNYTNHTILKEALEEWNDKRLAYLLPRQFYVIQKLNQEFCSKIRSKFPNDEDKVRRMSIIENGQVKMAHLAIYGSKKINGVAELHSEIIKNYLFKDFADMFPEKFLNITNGVTPRRWLLHCNPKLAQLITDKIGTKWLSDFSYLQDLRKYADDTNTQEEFWKIKRENKTILKEFLHQENPIRDHKGKIIGHSHCLPPDAIFDVQIKRIHEYKRQLMNALHALILMDEIKNNPDSRKAKRMIIFSGKAAPGYVRAKQIILLIFCIARKIQEEPNIKEKLQVAFVENYNVSRAEIIIPAADLSEQISTAGMEASGTGNMKLAINGALTIGTEDGANIEMRKAALDKWWPFSFGRSAEEIAQLKSSNSYNPTDIYIQNPRIKKAIDSLLDGSLIKSNSEHKALKELGNSLINPENGSSADRFFVLEDLQSFYEMQKKVEDLYLDQSKWAQYALHNIAGMEKFSSDQVIYNYASSIWDIERTPIVNEILEKVRKEYSDVQLF